MVRAQDINLESENYTFKITATSLRGQWVNEQVKLTIMHFGAGLVWLRLQQSTKQEIGTGPVHKKPQNPTLPKLRNSWP